MHNRRNRPKQRASLLGGQKVKRSKRGRLLKWPKIISRTLSLRLSLMVVLAVAVLLSVSLAVMLHFSRQALKHEALQNAEQTLEGTVQRVDNILLSVEQSVGNVYWDMLSHIDQQEQMEGYCRRIVECCPYVAGCAIAFEPDFYPGQEPFMVYVYRRDGMKDSTTPSELAVTHVFGKRPYTEQQWFTTPLKNGKARWTDPLKGVEVDGEALTTFSLPIYGKEGRAVGVVAADVPIRLLSQIILSAKPSANGYSTLLGNDGSYLVHPDTNKLLHQTVFTQTENGTNPTVRAAAEAMVAGETGYRYFTLNGSNCYVFYKPFQRAEVPGRVMERLGWSVGVIYPEEDIFAEYNLLLYYVLAIAIVGLLLFFMHCTMFTHRQLQPLQLLTRSAKQIASSVGSFNTQHSTFREDEIGQLQDCFQQMQQSLDANVCELEQLLATIEERGRGLRKVYGQAQEADRMKTAFLHNMTNQMMEPAKAIAASVDRLVAGDRDQETGDWRQETETIRQQSKAITDVLNHLLDAADSESGKEVHNG